MNAIFRSTRYAVNVIYGGNGRIYGNVTRQGGALSPVALLRLYDRKSGTLISKKWVFSNNGYSFDYLKIVNNGYYVIAFDYNSHPLNAAIADLVTPEPMP